MVLGALESIEMRIPVELIQRVTFSGRFWRLKGEKKANKGCLLVSLANLWLPIAIEGSSFNTVRRVALGIFNNDNDITTTATATVIITRLPFHIYKLLSICNNDQRGGRLD